MPGVNAACAVYQRCPVGPAVVPLGGVYQAANSALRIDLTSMVNPCPVAALNRFPENSKSALVGGGPVVEQVVFGSKRLKGMTPLRNVPSTIW